MIYRQERIGRNGVPFTMLKIETMREGVVTRPRLRRWGLDEVPQLVNVLRGEMAVFGPRPETPEIHARCSRVIGPVWDSRLAVKPGIVSLASIAGGIRTMSRYAIQTKIDQAVLDNIQIEAGFRGRLHVLLNLPRALARGQHTERSTA